MNLTEYVRQVSLEDFGREFRHRAEWNSRLQTDQGKGYRHKDLAFKQLLQQVDGLRFTPPLPEKTGRVKRIYLYQCPHCGQEYRRKRKIDLKKYACGRCRSRLQFLEMRQE